MQTREMVSDYEYKILVELEFSIHITPPLDFLERFERVFGIDEAKDGTEQIQSFARHMCFFT